MTDIPLLHVHIASSDVPQVQAEKRPKEKRVAHRTFVLTTANPTANIAGYDPARCEMYLNVLDNPVVVSGSTSQANDPANTVGALATPNGRMLPVSNGSEYCIPGPDETWLSAATYPTRVGVTIVRDIN